MVVLGSGEALFVKDYDTSSSFAFKALISTFTVLHFLVGLLQSLFEVRVCSLKRQYDMRSGGDNLGSGVGNR